MTDIMKTVNDIVIKLLGLLLMTAAILKGWQLLTEPIANKDIWTNRAFLIFTVEFELALGIWLLSGIFRKLAWSAALVCFSLFSAITLYKGLSGAASCGCFGPVQVNPWITLFVVDIPACLALAVFRPKGEKLFDWPTMPRFAALAGIGFAILSITAPILALNKPEKITSSYEVLEPEIWVGKELPILEYIDIGEKLKKGNWLVLFYHYDCPDCLEAIQKYEKIFRKIDINNIALGFAIIAIPPYGEGQVIAGSPCVLGRLLDVKEWFVTTPAMVLLKDSKATQTWEQKLPDLGKILDNIFTERR
jgi:hypothetical protein